MKDLPRKSQAKNKAIEEMAAAWLARRDRGFAGDEEAEFALWRFSDPRNTAAVARLEGAWGALDKLRDFRPDVHIHPDADLLAAPASARVLSVWKTAFLAAAAMLVLGVLAWWQLPHGLTTPRREAIVHPGPERLVLDDGSVVELNAGAKVEIHFTPAQRDVQLVRGEAHFAVAKNPARPFVVTAGKVAVRAVGTAFSVTMAHDEVAVLVTEGRVQVSDVRTVVAAVAPPRQLSQLGAGQRAVINTAQIDQPAPLPVAVQVHEMTPAEVERSLAWQGIRLEFVDMPLADVVADFNRYNRQKLAVDDSETGAIVVGGNFRADNVEAFVRLLDAGFGVSSNRKGDHITLHRSR